MSSPGGMALSSKREQSRQPRQEPQIGQEANQISEMPILVDADAIVESSVREVSQDTPTIDASREFMDGGSEFDLGLCH